MEIEGGGKGKEGRKGETRGKGRTPRSLETYVSVCCLLACLSIAVVLCRGVINTVSKGTAASPISHCCTAVGHSKAVLSLYAVVDLLFTGSKGASLSSCFFTQTFPVGVPESGHLVS